MHLNIAENGGLGLIGNNAACSFLNCQIFMNSAVQYGGALYFNESKSVILSNSNFSDNSAFVGGAIYTKTLKSYTIKNSIFRKNYAKPYVCSLLSGCGGAFFLANVSDLLIYELFTNNIFTQNEAATFGHHFGIDSSFSLSTKSNVSKLIESIFKSNLLGSQPIDVKISISKNVFFQGEEISILTKFSNIYN